ncbi:MAG: phosphatase PAP2 family protein, partial [bacterium]
MVLVYLQLWDAQITWWLNHHLANPLFDIVMPLFDAQINWMGPLLVIMMGVIIWGKRKGRIAVLGAVILVSITDYTSSGLLKPWVDRTRPCNILPELRVWIKGEGWMITPDPVDRIYRKSRSFPSGHATNSLAQALWWANIYPQIKIGVYLIALTIGLSRIYIGVHYMGDVVGGWLWGILWTMLMLGIARTVLPQLLKPEANDSSEK